MLNKILKHGTGSGAQAVEYLLDKNRHSIAPEIIKGNAVITTELIENTPFKRKYVSGVLSFAELISDKQRSDIIQEAEKTFFGNMNSDQYNILWVQHTDKGRTELHYILPRQELKTGKSLNISPPNQYKRTDAFRDYINAKYNLADPNDPMRERTVKVPDHLQKKKITDIRERIADIVNHGVAIGEIGDFEQLKNFITETYNVEIKRETQKGISISNPSGEGRNIRLNGPLFSADSFHAAQDKAETKMLANLYEDISVATNQNMDYSEEQLARAEKKLRHCQNKWSDYLAKEYKQKPIILEKEIKNEHRRTVVREVTGYVEKLGQANVRTGNHTEQRNEQSSDTGQKIEDVDRAFAKRKQHDENRISNFIANWFNELRYAVQRRRRRKTVIQTKVKKITTNAWITFLKYKKLKIYKKNPIDRNINKPINKIKNKKKQTQNRGSMKI